MKTSIYFAFLLTIILSGNAFAQNKTFLQKLAGNWEGTLEYLDYSENKRVKLKSYLTIKPASDGNSAEFQTVYDDVSHIIKDNETVKIDISAKKYFSGNSEYKIDSFEDGKIILHGSGQDGEKVEPIRQTITFDENSFTVLKETRSPWQFRNQTIFKRTSENILTKRTLSATDLHEDFKIFKETMTTIHPGIYRYQTPENLNKLFDEFETKLKTPLPEAEFFKLIAQFTNRINCGHTYVNPYNLNSIVRERVFNGENYLPFYFQIVDGKIIITENASSNNLAKGSEITQINGISVKQIIQNLLTVTKADGKHNLAHRVQTIELTRFDAERYALFDMYFPLFFPLKNETFDIEAVDFVTKKLTKFQTSAMTKEERTKEMAKRYGKSPTYDDGWKFEIRENSTAYLKIDNSITWRLKTIKFKEFLAATFAELKAKNIKNLIIDLRGNNGGDMDLGFELSRYLTSRILPPYAESKRLVRNVTARPNLLKNLETYSSELKSALQNGIPSTVYKDVGNGYFEILPNKDTSNYPQVSPYQNNYSGNAYIIADSSNASATFQFLHYVDENKLAKIVGQPSGGNKQGINGGNYFFLNLPNSKVEIDIPVYFQSPLSPQKDISNIPKVIVKKEFTDIGNNLDREIITIRQMIKRN